MLRYLTERHDVTLISFIRSTDRQEDIDHLRPFCSEVHTVLLKRNYKKNITALIASIMRKQPAIILRDQLSEMEMLLQELVQVRHFDVIHADQTAMAQYALYARSISPSNARPGILLDEHNALYQVLERQSNFEGWPNRFLWRREARKMAHYEADLLRRFDHILTVSKEDKSALLQLFSRNEAGKVREKITPIPICVDPESQEPIEREQNGDNIIHLGTMFWPPNREAVLWFGHSVFPLILDQIPGAVFIVAGSDPDPSIFALSQSSSSVGKNVSVLGFVADPIPYLSRSRVFVVPLLAGGGMRVKILDSWNWGIPVVSTTIGAEGIEVQHGRNILIANDPEEFAQAVIRIFSDQELAKDLSIGGRRSVEKHYNWRRVYAAVDEIYSKIVN